MEHLDHPSPQIKDGKMARFSLRATSSLIFFWGEGVGGFLFHVIPSGIVVPSVHSKKPLLCKNSNADLNECNNSNNINKIKLQTVDPAISKTQEAQADCARERKVH